ncbi:MAG: tRNA pseudouridine(38-40) synthase TruA, partial [Ectothiorhodospiraceae bacterium]|nr:tRNA pseudouridine(38-40) synthase TruA [Ectothiorhodospiraceae bacterium]
AAHARRCVNSVQVWRQGDFVYLDITANAFLHHMVRNIAGALMAVGSGEQPAEWIADVLQARDRTSAGVTAPAGGLYLVAAHYPEEFRLPRPPRPPLFSG